MIIRKRPHRRTGNPRGRPPILPCDLYYQILTFYRKRVDPQTGLVKTSWRELAKELGVGRTTIAKNISMLKDLGYIKSVNASAMGIVKANKFDCYYRLTLPNSRSSQNNY